MSDSERERGGGGGGGERTRHEEIYTDDDIRTARYHRNDFENSCCEDDEVGK